MFLSSSKTAGRFLLPVSLFVACEAGISLGSVDLSEETVHGLQGAGVLSVRIDDHPETVAWTMAHPGGRTESREIVIPTGPLEVPDAALQDQWSLTEWVIDSHGGLGRLLLWDAGADWWVLNEPDHGLTLICSERSKFENEFNKWDPMPFGWVNEAFWTAEGISIAEALSEKYSLGWVR